MGHRHDTVEALHAYVADLEPSITDGVVGRGGAAGGGDISVSGRVFGASHFGLLAATAGAFADVLCVPTVFGLFGTPGSDMPPTVTDGGGVHAASSPLHFPTGDATAERAVGRGDGGARDAWGDGPPVGASEDAIGSDSDVNGNGGRADT